ncbi:MAG: hypothetical protein A2275_05750 [Bacteroidetes bacterium RIFOXYA12_FULL_35_11]|nr:MAG: hypothetical protein A2X01_10910 [Bacteroidetes bacterium GWF2_35_48]OFY74985.1 MAG: hypothetical protein A2275_05750 [Bacteroidetes bacterium RIFOXYA12_FULL_35_11]OFY97372.1 MAG: hypothetical protein A2309_14135 [Bacteroidetes bacterium RIFOXYB2_FULL_35_7]
MFSNLQYNPAFAGQTKMINAGLLAREQWTGLKSAPSTQVLNGDMWFKFGGLGLSVINDRLGYEHSFRFNALYAYHYRLSNKMQVSAGAGLGIINKSLQGSQLIYVSQNDQNAITTDISEYNANIDLGLSIVYDKLIAGVSCTHINKSVKASDFTTPPRHLWIYAKYSYTLNDLIKLQPSLLLKSAFFKTQLEINTNCLLKDKYWVGLTYRHKESVVALIGIQLNQHIKAGYSYDLPFGPIKGQSYGNHEIFLIYSIDRKLDLPVFDNNPRYL